MWRGGTFELELCWASMGVMGWQSYLGFRTLAWTLVKDEISARSVGWDLSLIFKHRFNFLDMTQIGRRETTHMQANIHTSPFTVWDHILLMLHKLKQCNMQKSIHSGSYSIFPMGPLSHMQLLVRRTALLVKGWLLCVAALSHEHIHPIESDYTNSVLKATFLILKTTVSG